MHTFNFVTLDTGFELYPLLLFMIIGALAAVRMKDLFSSVIAVGAVGLGLSLAFLLLKAPDLAIVQIVVEILCLIILVGATIRRDTTKLEKKREILKLVLICIFIVLFLFFSWKALRELPPFGEPLMKVSSEYIKEGLKETGATNLVSSVILDFRAFDTLGEATVLFTAVIGVFVVLRKVGRKNKNEE